MIKGTRVEGTNSVIVGTGGTCPSLITVPTNKTFVLTDLSMTATYGVDTGLGVASMDVLAFYDLVMSGGTAGSGTSNAVFKINWDGYRESSSTTAVTPVLMRRSSVYHFTNGPEFSRAVSAEVSGANSANIGTGCLWVAGILR